MKDAQVAILDEPTSGLDPQVTLELLEIIRDLKNRGVSVLLSSHLLARVQSVCDRVALFNEGNIVLIGTVPELGRQVLGGGFRVEVEAEGQGLEVAPCRSPRRAEGGERRPHAVSAACRARCASRSGGCRGSGAHGRLLRLAVEEPSLEAIYSGISTSIPNRESAMRREGSALNGLGVVVLKELRDHLTSVRMRVLECACRTFCACSALSRDPAGPGDDGGRSFPAVAIVHASARRHPDHVRCLLEHSSFQ